MSNDNPNRNSEHWRGARAHSFLPRKIRRIREGIYDYAKDDPNHFAATSLEIAIVVALVTTMIGLGANYYFYSLSQGDTTVVEAVHQSTKYIHDEVERIPKNVVESLQGSIPLPLPRPMQPLPGPQPPRDLRVVKSDLIPLIEWSKKGLNSTTKAQLPIFISKENDYDADYRIVEYLSFNLKKDGLVIVNDASKAALFIEISHVIQDSYFNIEATNTRTNDSWLGNARFNMSFSWVGGRPLTAEPIKGVAPSDGPELAKEAAVEDAKKKAREFILSLANKR